MVMFDYVNVVVRIALNNPISFKIVVLTNNSVT